jgi:hypothetical protein
MIIPRNFVRKFWWDGRIGHTTYLMFLLTIVNFMIIAYNFLLEGNEFFEKFEEYLWLFGIIFLMLYVPVGILIGRWHVNTQLSVELEMRMLENPIMAKMVRGILDDKIGKATKEETEEFRKFLKEIESRDIKEF